jgi:hypothetical protein
LGFVGTGAGSPRASTGFAWVYFTRGLGIKSRGLEIPALPIEEFLKVNTGI